MSKRTSVLVLTFALQLLQAAAPSVAAETPFGDAFWSHWSDGRAEISSYDLSFPRYGEERTATAVAIFVTENFSLERRVKVDGRANGADVVPVMKLNLAIDFPTGIYDYNLMTSVFVTTAEADGAAGSAVKVSFSSQEWCGHVYQQLLPDPQSVRFTQHSYFDGEADADVKLDRPDGGVLEDTLFHWARGLAAPFVGRGETTSVALLTASDTIRLAHQPATWRKATLTRAAKGETLTVPAGRFEVERSTVQVPGHRSWTFWVELATPNRIVAWSTSDGQRAELVESKRLPYWKMNGRGDEQSLPEIGLRRRPRRTM